MTCLSSLPGGGLDSHHPLFAWAAGVSQRARAHAPLLDRRAQHLGFLGTAVQNSGFMELQFSCVVGGGGATSYP